MGTDEAPDAWTSLVLLERFRGGDELAAEALFARYFERLTSLARSRLSTRLARRTDPEDIVLSVYRSFFVEAREGRYTLGRGGDLWRLLSSITRHKLLRQVRHQSAGPPLVRRRGPARSCRRRKVRPPPIRSHPGRSPRVNRRAGTGLLTPGSLREARPGTPAARPADLGNRGRRRPLGTLRATLARPDPRPCWPIDSTMPDEEFESRVFRFEKAWRLHGPCEIDDYLGHPFERASPARPLARGVDLRRSGISLAKSRRRRTGHAGDYVEQFPELISLDRLPLELIGEEYRVRRRWGDRPSPAEFLSRFHERREQIRAELFRVDAEIEEEAAEPGQHRGTCLTKLPSGGTGRSGPGGPPALAPRLPATTVDRGGEDGKGLRGPSARRGT